MNIKGLFNDLHVYYDTLSTYWFYEGRNLNLYDIAGTVNTAFISVSLYGVFSQLRKIWRRKDNRDNSVRPTELLSLNQFTVSYLAYLSFFIYGYSIEPFNHYIVWPRLIASVLVLQIIMEILLDRKSAGAKVSFSIAASSLIVAFVGLFFGETISDTGKFISTSIILIVSVLIAQAYLHQIRLIFKSGHTGAVDLKMSQFIFMMDLSTIVFALSMGFAEGWPLLVLAVTSAVTKLIIMYLFRWVATSPLAATRRSDELSQNA